MNLGHPEPPIIQRPWGSARSPPLAGSGEAKKTKHPAERRSGGGSARHEQPFNLLEPEAGVARPLVDLDPRRAFVAQDCFQHGALHSAHAPDPQPETEPHKYAVLPLAPLPRERVRCVPGMLNSSEVKVLYPT